MRADLAAANQAHKQAVAARIRQSTALSPFLRERMAALVETSGEAVGGTTSVPIDDAIRALEEALPDFLQYDRQRSGRSEHPAGDAFFSGDPNSLSDAQAEEIARKQLARSGLLRGQRARIAD